MFAVPGLQNVTRQRLGMTAPIVDRAMRWKSNELTLSTRYMVLFELCIPIFKANLRYSYLLFALLDKIGEVISYSF